MDCSPPGSSVHGIFQARVFEWGSIAFSSMVLQARTKNKNQGWHYLRMLLLLPVFCLMVTIFSVLCYTSHFCPYSEWRESVHGLSTNGGLTVKCFIVGSRVRCHCCPPLDFSENVPQQSLAPKFSSLQDSWYSLTAIFIALVVFSCSAPLHTWSWDIVERGVDQDCKAHAWCLGVECMIRPLKIAVLLLSVHPCTRPVPYSLTWLSNRLIIKLN